MEDWVALYKFMRLGSLAVALVGIGAWVFSSQRRDRLEAPARAMLEDGE